MADTLTQIETTTTSDVVRFHLSLNVADLARSVAFFEILFDRPPARRESDYAKFEIEQPPLVLSLIPNRMPQGGALNHVGFRLTGSDALVAMQRRLEMHGLRTQREEGVECCYSRQTKFWVSDPDGNLWEMYTLQEDAEHHAECATPIVSLAPTNRAVEQPPSAAAPAIWAHRLGEPFPRAVMVEDEGVDEVLLQGTFNARVSADDAGHILSEALRILKSGARATVHQLTAAQAIERLSQPLPGPAAAVEVVPTAEWLAAQFEAAGFVDVRFEKLSNSPCFVADGVECRETKLVAFKRHAADSVAQTSRVLYKGPFRAVEDDRGNLFRRGQWTTVDAATRRDLAARNDCEQFLLADGDDPV